jgi:hypothetical protein
MIATICRCWRCLNQCSRTNQLDLADADHAEHDQPGRAHLACQPSLASKQATFTDIRMG